MSEGTGRYGNLADAMLLSILQRENDFVKIAEAIVTWRRAREALDHHTTQSEKST